MIRIFIAIPIPIDLGRQLVALVPADLGGLKRVAPELLHVTLAFVGWLDGGRVPDVTAAVESALPAARAFDVEMAGVGRFPPTGRPRVVWVGSAAAPRIEELGELVRTGLSRHGVPFDPKPLRPHVTLARVREDASPEQARVIAAAVLAARLPYGLRFSADRVHVMESVLGRAGPRYSSRAQVTLRSSDQGHVPL